MRVRRQQSLPTLRQSLWSCGPGAMNGSLPLPRLLQDLLRVNKADLAAQGMFRLHFVKISTTSLAHRRMPRRERGKSFVEGSRKARPIALSNRWQDPARRLPICGCRFVPSSTLWRAHKPDSFSSDGSNRGGPKRFRLEHDDWFAPRVPRITISCQREQPAA